jgi:hypothetical protein
MLEAQKAMADSMAQIARPLMEVQRHFAEMNERIAAQLQKVARAMKAALEREARNRGITVPELLEALRSSAEVMEDADELKKLQAVVAYNLYQNREISLVRFIRALPLEYRPAPAERTGIADEDFEPLVSGITRKD